ncbi:Carotenoid cleavage dioxygenase 7, chloroplastic [Dionaea muscipula]
MQAPSLYNISSTRFPLPSPPLKSPFKQCKHPGWVPASISFNSTGNNTGAAAPEINNNAATAFWDYQLLFMSQRLETPQPISLSLVDGSLPADFPSGTYYLTGPGQMMDDYGSMVHPLDGHGYLRAFGFDGPRGEVRYSGKYVRTRAQLEEFDPVNGSWRFTHRGPFSVLRAGKMMGNVKVMKNVANTCVLWWGGRLFCLWEGGLPYEIHPRTLHTIGQFDFKVDVEEEDANGVFPVDYVWDIAARLLKPILYGIFKMSPKRILSHYKVDGQRNRLLIMSCNAEDMLLPRSHFTFYEFDPNFKLLQTREFSIPGHLMIHDWAFTNTHYILLGNRVKLDVSGSIRAVSGFSPMISALSVNPKRQTCPIYLLPRFANTESERWRVPVEAPKQLWLLHVANAFENFDDKGNLCIQIHASTCSYQWFNFHKLFGYKWQSGSLDPSQMNARVGEVNLLPHLVQVSINLDAMGNCQNCIVEPLSNKLGRPSDYPAINPKCSGTKSTYIYAAASSGSHPALPHFPYDTIFKLNTVNKSVHAWSAGRRRFVGEPVFVPKEPAEEDDGYILLVEYAVSIQRCYLVILNPKNMGEAEAFVARFEVPKFLTFPFGFHGTWAPTQ